MTVRVYGISASGYRKPSLDSTKKNNLGNGLNFGNGIILTASYLFDEDFPDGSVFTADSQYFGVDQDQAKGKYGIPVSAPENLYAYNRASPSGTDLAILRIGHGIRIAARAAACQCRLGVYGRAQVYNSIGAVKGLVSNGSYS